MLKRLRSLWLTVLAVCLCSGRLPAEIIFVPDDYPTVQAGVNAAQSGDTVLVHAGVYVENVIIPAHDLTLAGEYLLSGDTSRVDSCVLYSPGGRCIRADSAQQCTLRLVGLTIRGGVFDRSVRGGVHFDRRWVEMSHCRVDSAGRVFGGLLTAIHCTLNITGCRFLYGYAQGDGTLLLLDESVATLTGCEIAYDLCWSEGGMNAAVDVHNGIAELRNCLVHDLGWAYYMGYCFANARGTRSTVQLVECEIRDSRFQHFFARADTQEIIVFDSNLVRNCQIQMDLFGSWMAARVCEARFRDNVFVDNSDVPQVIGRMFLCFATIPERPILVRAEVRGNLFLRNYNREYSCIGLYSTVGHDVRISHNYFFENSCNGFAVPPGGSVVLRDSNPEVFHHNVFAGNHGFAGFHGGGVGFPPGEALHCFWGDSTGPYQEQTNPFGHGDTLDVGIDYVPWEVDTSFLAVSPLIHIPKPLDFLIGCAYPNPFNAAVTIEFAVTRDERITLEVFDLLGRRIAVLKDGVQRIGVHRVVWDASGQASGLYLARLSARDSRQKPWVQKLMLIK